MKKAKYAVKVRAINEAMKHGRNAIIGTSINYTVFSKDIIGVVFTGTAVYIEYSNPYDVWGSFSSFNRI